MYGLGEAYQPGLEIKDALEHHETPPIEYLVLNPIIGLEVSEKAQHFICFSFLKHAVYQGAKQLPKTRHYNKEAEEKTTNSLKSQQKSKFQNLAEVQSKRQRMEVEEISLHEEEPKAPEEKKKKKFEETEEEAQRRFLMELEFIQCLASPHYLNCKNDLF